MFFFHVCFNFESTDVYSEKQPTFFPNLPPPPISLEFFLDPRLNRKIESAEIYFKVKLVKNKSL